jgi:hypothetical protein
VKPPSQGREVLPLAGAAERLRRPPGRPRKAQGTESAQASQTSGPPAAPPFMRAPDVPVPGLCPRLLDLGTTAIYLGVSPWTVRDLEAAGTLKRVRVPMAGSGELRKLLFDRQDLDRLVEAWKG